MRVPLTEELLQQAQRYSLRTACRHCLFLLDDGSCLHEWPNDEQKHWPIDAPLANGERPSEVGFCKEFELL